MAVVHTSGVASGCGSGNGYQMRVAVSRCAEACGGCTVLAQIIGESPFTGRIVRDGLLPFPSDSGGQFLWLV
jgi:hypothetical protein